MMVRLGSACERRARDGPATTSASAVGRDHVTVSSQAKCALFALADRDIDVEFRKRQRALSSRLLDGVSLSSVLRRQLVDVMTCSPGGLARTLPYDRNIDPDSEICSST